MSQDQHPTAGAHATDSLAADMPSVPGAQTAKNIIENAVHPHQDAAPPVGQAPPVPSGTSAPAAAAPAQPAAAAVQRSAGTTATAEPFVDQIIELSIMGESLTFAKRAMVTEEVRLQKRPFTEQQSVTGAVRRERVTVEGADVVEGADDQINQTTSGAGSTQETRGDARDTLREGAENAQEGAANTKHGLDGMIDGAVDRMFGGRH